ncbi:MAG: hypothetical protein E7161_04970 [Firmicutes bacterium]|nr:hypothetical protein [Bacillota bacterium]
MKFIKIFYAFLLGLINRNILAKIPVFLVYNKMSNITIIIIVEVLIFILLEIFLYKKNTLKESIIVSIVRIGSYFLGYVLDYFFIYPQFENIFDNITYSLIHMLSTKIMFLLIFTSSLIGLIISANKEDKWNDYKEYIKKEEQQKTSN